MRRLSARLFFEIGILGHPPSVMLWMAEKGGRNRLEFEPKIQVNTGEYRLIQVNTAKKNEILSILLILSKFGRSQSKVSRTKSHQK
jgi:hypothetical protein